MRVAQVIKKYKMDHEKSEPAFSDRVCSIHFHMDNQSQYLTIRKNFLEQHKKKM